MTFEIEFFQSWCVRFDDRGNLFRRCDEWTCFVGAASQRCHGDRNREQWNDPKRWIHLRILVRAGARVPWHVGCTSAWQMPSTKRSDLADVRHLAREKFGYDALTPAQ